MLRVDAGIGQPGLELRLDARGVPRGIDEQRRSEQNDRGERGEDGQQQRALVGAHGLY